MTTLMDGARTGSSEVVRVARACTGEARIAEDAGRNLQIGTEDVSKANQRQYPQDTPD